MPRPPAQGAHNGICVLLPRCRCLSLNRGQHRTQEHHWDMVPILLNLLRDRTDCLVRGIRPEDKCLVRNEEVQGEGREEGGLHVIKGLL